MSAPSAPIIQPQTWASLSSITFYWAPPASIGSSLITNYTLLCSSISYSTVLGPNTYNVQISSLTNNVDYVFQIAASNSNGTSPYAKFNLAQAGTLAAGASSVTVSTVDISTVNVNWSYSTNANEAKAQFFGVSILPSTGTTSTLIAVAYANERNKYITNLSTNNYTFLVQAISNAGWAFPHSYSFSPMTFVGSAIVPVLPAFTPTAIPGLQVWLDGADPLGTGAPPSNGSTLLTWNDKSGNAYNATGVSNPVYTSPTEGIALNGSSQYFSLNYAGTHTTETAFVVVKFTNTTGEQDIISGNVTRTRQFVVFQNLLNMYSYAGGGLVTSTTVPTAGTQVLLCYALNASTNLSIYNGGNLLKSATGFTPLAESNIKIGVNGFADGGFLNGSILELLIYNSVLTTATRQITEGYLAWKWSLQTNLPVSHPYRSAPPTAATAFVPTMIAGAQLWLDGADPSATGIAPANGSTLTTWNDKSGNAYNTTGIVGTPTYNSSLKSVSFNGSSYFNLPNNSIPFGNSSYSIYIVATFNNGGVYNGLLTAGIAANSQCISIVSLLDNKIRLYWYNSDIDTTSAFTPATRFLYESFYESGAQRTAYINGTLSATNTPSARNQPNTGNKIGVTVNGETLTGSISEILIFNNSLSTTNRQLIEGYLAWKWGTQTSLPTTHPYASAPVSLILPSPLVYLYATTYSGSGTWLDSSPNGKNATLENGVIAKNTAGNGIVLNGSTNWTFPNIAAGNSWTACVWYKNTGTPVGSSNDYGNKGACILAQYFVPGPDSVINLTIGSGGVTTANNGYYSGALFSGSWRNGTLFSLTNNVWAQIIVSWDGTNMITYLNGSLFGSTAPGGTGTDNTRAYRIGRRWDTADYMVGEIGEVRIYKEPLTSAQVLNLYNTTVGTYMPPLLVYLYATTYSGSGTWLDSSTNGKNATLEAGTAAKNAAGNGVVLNGSTTWTFPNLALGNSWTASAWYKGTATNTGYPAIITQNFPGGNYMNMYLGRNTTPTTSIQSGFFSGGWINGTDQGAFPIGTWIHVLATWNGTNLSTYINGSLLGTTTPGGTATDAASYYRIGGDIGAPPTAFLKGEVGEVRIYSQPLNATQAKYLYTSTQASYSS